MARVAKRMTPAQKAKWVKALVSGKYKQGHGRLERNGKHCCLGVAMRECGLPNNDSNNMFLFDGAGDPMFLPMDVQRGLAYMNDAGVPFEVIAGLIDQAL